MDQKLKIAGATFLLVLGSLPLIAAGPTLVSFKQGDFKNTPRDSAHPSISDDGQFIVFESLAKLTSDDLNKTKDIYLFDQQTKRLKRLPSPQSKRKNGGPVLSGDGSHVAFHSYAPIDLQSGIPQNADLCVLALSTDKPTWPIPAILKAPVDGESLFPTLDKAGNRILFTSNSTRIMEGQSNGFAQIYSLDQEKGEIFRLSQNARGEPANRSCGFPRLSADGKKGAFITTATNFDPALPEENLTPHLYFFDLSVGTITRVDMLEKGLNPAAWIIGAFDMDSYGNTLIFEARLRQANPMKMLSAVDLFIYDRVRDQVTLLTEGLFQGKSRNPSMSADGDFVAFVLSGGGGIVLYSRVQDRWESLVNGNCENPTISNDGRFIAFERRDKKAKNIYVIKNPMSEEK